MNSNWVFFLYQYIFKFTPPKSTPKNTWNLKSLEPPLEKGTHDHAITRNLSKYSISLTSMNPQDIFEDPSNNSSTHETFTKKHPAFLKTTQKISHRFFPSNQKPPVLSGQGSARTVLHQQRRKPRKKRRKPRPFGMGKEGFLVMRWFLMWGGG